MSQLFLLSLFPPSCSQRLSCDAMFSKAATKRNLLLRSPLSPLPKPPSFAWSRTDERSAEKRGSSVVVWDFPTAASSIRRGVARPAQTPTSLIPRPPIAASSAFTPAACEAMLPSLAKAHLFKRVGYIAARSVWWLQSDSPQELIKSGSEAGPPHPPTPTPYYNHRYGIPATLGGGMTDKERE